MRPHESETDMLQRYLAWLKNDVLKGYERRKDVASIRQTKRQIDDIEYRLETNPPRPRPDCGWDRPLKEHPGPDSDAIVQFGTHKRAHGKHCFRGAGKTNSEDTLIEDTSDE